MEKLTLEHIAPYLPYGLIVQSKKHYCKYGEQTLLKVNGLSFADTAETPHWQYEFIYEDDIKFADINEKGFKPVLLPISSLTKPMEDGRVPLIECAKIAFPDEKFVVESKEDLLVSCADFDFGFRDGSFKASGYAWKSIHVPNQLALFQYLAKEKIDFMGLIDAGKAIDATTLNVNPYSNGSK